MPNIVDVARRAGVSIKTVSRVINGSPSVRPRTRERVQAAVRALDFHPHASARSLARHRSHAIGVLTPTAPERVFAHQYFFQLLHGIGEALAQRGYELLLHAQGDERSFVALWKERRVDGVILMNVPIGDPRVIELCLAGAPLVLTCRPDMPGSTLDRAVSWVDADQAAGAEAGATHLLALGHRRLALLNGPGNLMVSHLRAAGFRRAVARYQHCEPCAIEEVVLSAEFSIEAGVALGGLLLQRAAPPTAIVCGDDTLAIGVIHAARTRGLCVPDDLSVVGFDDITISPYVDPPLTTVRQVTEEKGRAAAGLLLDMLVGSEVADPKHLVLPTELVVRASTAPPPRA